MNYASSWSFATVKFLQTYISNILNVVNCEDKMNKIILYLYALQFCSMLVKLGL